MISDILGLSINQKVLNKKSPSSVVKTFEKTATNYIAIGRMAEDLKLIRLNFSRWLAMEGVKVRGTPDMHMLKEDELTKKFGVLREKYTKSKVTRAAQDGTSGNRGWAKSLLEKYINYKIERKIQRKITAAILNRTRKFTTIRKLIRLKKKLSIIVNRLLDKINIKKMFMTWAKKNYNTIIKPFVVGIKNAAKKFIKKGLSKLVIRFSLATLASIFTGPLAPIIGAIITVSLMIFQPLLDAWEEYKKGGDFFETFIISLMDEFSLGLFERSTLKDAKDSFVKFHEDLFFSLMDCIDKSFKYVEEKMTSFAEFIIKKGESMFVTKSNMGDFISAFETANAKRLEEEEQTRQKYAKYFEQMQERIDQKKVRIRQLEIEISQLEYDLKVLVEGPEKARLEATKIEKVKQEQEKEKLEEEVKKSREGGAPKEEAKPAAKKEVKPVVAPAPAATPAPKTAPPPPPQKVAEKPKEYTPTKTSGQYSEIKQMIIAYEGWENKPYPDSEGLWTIGVGHLIGDGKKLPFKDKDGTTYTKDTYLTNPQVRALFEKDFEAHLKLAEKAPGWNLANQAGKTALIDLTFNMGPRWIKKFTKTASLLEEGKFKEAAQELKRGSKGGDSLWYKQVGERAKFIVTLMSAGAANDKSGSEALASVMGSQKVASGGKFMSDESIQLAEAQRKQLKPKDINVADASKTNNKKIVRQENVAMNKPGPDAGSTMTNRAAA